MAGQSVSPEVMEYVLRKRGEAPGLLGGATLTPPLNPAILDWLQKQALSQGTGPAAPAPDSGPPAPAPPPPDAGAPPQPPAAPQDPATGYMGAIKQYLAQYGPDALQKVQDRQRMEDITSRLGGRLDNATSLITGGPAPGPQMAPYDRVKDWVMRKQVGQENLGTQMQVMQMDPAGPLAQANLAGLKAAGIDLPPGTSPMVADSYMKALKAGIDPQKIMSEIKASLASANKSNVEAGAIPQDIAIKTAALQKDYDLKGQEIAAAAKQGDLNRANELTKAQLEITAQMTRLRAGISAENTGDADWQIGDQFAAGNKKLPPAAQEFLKKSPGARALLDNSARAEELLKAHPDGVVRGDDAANLHRWLSEMTSQLNGIWGMGVLRQNNMPMLSEALQDPTKLESIIKNKISGRDFTNQLHQFQTMVKQRMYSEGTGTGALTPKAGGYYEGFQSSSGKGAGAGSAAAPERRVLPDGRVLERLADGTVREAQ